MLKEYFQTEQMLELQNFVEQINNVVDHMGPAFYSFDLDHLYIATGFIAFLGDIFLRHFLIRPTPF